MTTVEAKYKKRLLTCMTHVLPEYDDAAKTVTVPNQDVKTIATLIEHDNHGNRRRVEALVCCNKVKRFPCSGSMNHAGFMEGGAPGVGGKEGWEG